MSQELSPSDAAKRASALHAADLVESGMKLGLGTGSTAEWLVRVLGEMVREEGLRITCAATSTRTADLARSEGIEVRGLDDLGRLDLTIDGTDEFDPALNLIKGGGGAHLQEKITAAASDRMAVICDPSKEVEVLGRFPLPVEVIPFGADTTRGLIRAMLEHHDVDGRDMAFRERDGAGFVSDEGNRILDLHLGRIGDAQALSHALNQIPGVVENGLFLGMCDLVIMGRADGTGEMLRRGAEGALERRALATHAGAEPGENIFADLGED